MKGVNHFFQGRFEIALKPLLETQKIFPESNMLNFWISLVFVYNNRYNESLDFIDKYVKEPGQDLFGQMCIFLKHILKGDKKKLSSLLYSDFVESVKKDCQYSWHMATFYSFIDEKDQSFYWLENAVERGFINYPFISEQDKLLNNIRGEQRFMKLMERVKHEWENFEV